MADIIKLEDYVMGKVSELICVNCGKRYIGWRPLGTKLKDLECENCGVGFIIETGEELDDVEN